MDNERFAKDETTMQDDDEEEEKEEEEEEEEDDCKKSLGKFMAADAAKVMRVTASRFWWIRMLMKKCVWVDG